jgi:hypothetical protein
VTEYANPSWAAPCARYMDYMIQTISFVNMTQRGADVLTKMPQTIDALMNASKIPKDEKDAHEKELKELKWAAELAKSEIESDFALLHSHTLMGSWGALEGMIKDLVISWMQHNPSVLDDPRITKVKVPLVEFQKMGDHDRLRFLVTEIQRDLGLELKSGATKFESLLALVGLGGSVHRKVRDALFECQNLRNLFAHRGGVADRKFVANCPHLKYSVGDTVKLGSRDFSRNFFGLMTYGVIILNRCRSIEGTRLWEDNDFPGFEDVSLTSAEFGGTSQGGA